MPSVAFTPKLSDEYVTLFNTCVVRPERTAEVERLTQKILDNRARYEAVGDAIGVPWCFVGVVHCMEASLSFRGHLHNGDPLTARTVQVPKGRPRSGSPPFTWEESAKDALVGHRLGAQTDWSLAGTLFQLERYNGFGYRLSHPEVKSPYLWSFSTHYTSGKFVRDGEWSPTAKSQQCGAAVMLRRMAERRLIEFADQPAPAPNDPPLVVRFSSKRPADPEQVRAAEELQRFLNTVPGIFVKIDGVPGEKTSDAFKAVTGRHLPGDPRGD
jgi:lysozyme family protein